jgi:hypothetical protein
LEDLEKTRIFLALCERGEAQPAQASAAIKPASAMVKVFIMDEE